jgi:hypothetical protein
MGVEFILVRLLIKFNIMLKIKLLQFVHLIIIAIALVSFVCSCDKVTTPENKTAITSSDTNRVYKVVAHRGGAAECGFPDCTIASLKYAIKLRCYASECDITLTKDNNIIIGHTDSNGYQVNGVTPYEHTLAEIRAAGILANGEVVPTLSDFINILKDKKQNPHGTKIWMDVKRLTKNGIQVDVNNSINACFRACEIIKEMSAEKYCEFLIPTGDDIFDAVKGKVYANYRINFAWMTCTSPSRYGDAWAQIAYAKLFGTGVTYTANDYISANVSLSIYNVDDDATMTTVIPYYSRLKAIFTNYPNTLIKKLIVGGYEK